MVDVGQRCAYGTRIVKQRQTVADMTAQAIHITVNPLPPLPCSPKPLAMSQRDIELLAGAHAGLTVLGSKDGISILAFPVASADMVAFWRAIEPIYEAGGSPDGVDATGEAYIAIVRAAVARWDRMEENDKAE
jgi:hypothetical protein